VIDRVKTGVCTVNWIEEREKMYRTKKPRERAAKESFQVL
jgi:hypothetical protein